MRSRCRGVTYMHAVHVTTNLIVTLMCNLANWKVYNYWMLCVFFVVWNLWNNSTGCSAHRTASTTHQSWHHWFWLFLGYRTYGSNLTLLQHNTCMIQSIIIVGLGYRGTLAVFESIDVHVDILGWWGGCGLGAVVKLNGIAWSLISRPLT